MKSTFSNKKSMLYNFVDKNVFVIGGSSGLGLAMAKGFILHGANVAIGGRSLSKIKSAQKNIEEENLIKPFAIMLDVADTTSVKNSLKKFVKRFKKIDILICTAGKHLKIPTLKMKFKEWKDIIDTNLHGTYIVNTVFGETMIKQGFGSIINVSSLGARVSLSQAVAYNVSKSGVESLTKCLATEWAEYNVRVNSILPGVFKTPLNEKALSDKKRVDDILRHTPMKRFGKLSEIVSAAFFLASDDSSFVTGSSVIVDGGFLAFAGF